MEYEVYRHKDATDEDFENIDALFKRILTEDKWLCNETQRNLDSGIYVNGQMHAQFENGPLYLQSLVRKAIYSHREEERKRRMEVWPAAQNVTGLKDTEGDMMFCSGLSCDSKHQEELKW